MNKTILSFSSYLIKALWLLFIFSWLRLGQTDKTGMRTGVVLWVLLIILWMYMKRKSK